MSIRSASIEIVRTVATTDFRNYYPEVGDILSVESENGKAQLGVERGFRMLKDILEGAGDLILVGEVTFVSAWLPVKENLEVQVLVNMTPATMTFIWKFDGQLSTSGISNGNGGW